MKCNKNGFTLIELMVVVAIIGILSAIAYPSYQESMRKSRRADAEGALLALANAMERLFTATNSYCDAADAAGVVVGGDNCGLAGVNDTGSPLGTVYVPPINTSTFYQISIINGAAPLLPLAATSYTLQALPIGAQANDRCGTLTLTSTGAKGQAAAATAAECWKN